MQHDQQLSRNGDALQEAIAILKRANLHAWYPGKQELWVGWQNCESMKMDPLHQVIDMLESIAKSETAPRWKEISLNVRDAVRGVAWVDEQAQYIGKIENGKCYLMEMPK